MPKPWTWKSYVTLGVAVTSHLAISVLANKLVDQQYRDGGPNIGEAFATMATGATVWMGGFGLFKFFESCQKKFCAKPRGAASYSRDYRSWSVAAMFGMSLTSPVLGKLMLGSAVKLSVLQSFFIGAQGTFVGGLSFTLLLNQLHAVCRLHSLKQFCHEQMSLVKQSLCMGWSNVLGIVGFQTVALAILPEEVPAMNHLHLLVAEAAASLVSAGLLWRTRGHESTLAVVAGSNHPPDGLAGSLNCLLDVVGLFCCGSSNSGSKPSAVAEFARRDSGAQGMGPGDVEVAVTERAASPVGGGASSMPPGPSDAMTLHQPPPQQML